MTGDMQKVVCALKIKYNSTINTCNVQQCVTRLNQIVSLMCVCGGGGERTAVSLCKLRLQLPSKEKQYKYTLS